MTDTAPRSSIVSIPAGVAFLDCLCERLIDGTLLSGADGEPAAQLADATVLLPNRRAARVLADMLSNRAGGAVILPRIAAIGDVDEDAALAGQFADPEFDAGAALGRGMLLPVPPAVSQLERHLALTRLVYEFGIHKASALSYPRRDEAILIPTGAADASALARDLARLLDAMETEEVAASALTGLVPENHAEYWNIAHAFLNIVVESWPQHLAERGLSDPVARRSALIGAETAQLAARREERPYIVAGSTGSVPATARLMKIVSNLPRGWVVLPGLDRDLDDASWKAVEAQAQTHPQHGLAKLLASLGVDRADVPDLLPAHDHATPPAALMTEIFRPAETSELWQERRGTVAKDAAGHLALCECETPQEEALTIAFALREAIESGKATAALVTPDRNLARRVSAQLRRWSLNVDDTAGRPLSATPAGTFLRLVCEAVAEAFAPVPLTALLDHPLFRNEAGDKTRSGVEALEVMVLRGPRPQPGIVGLRLAYMGAATAEQLHNRVAARLRGSSTAEAGALIDLLERATQPLAPATSGKAPFIETMSHLAQAAIALSGGRDAAGTPRLFTGEDGIQLARFLAEIEACFDTGMELPFGALPAFIGSLMDGVPVRGYAQDRRIAILGPLEARLLQFDRVVLGGLNEGTWPGDAKTDPWLSRAMRAQLGLDLPERRIGQAAHDLAQHMAAGDVVVTRAARNEGAPAVASRWLQRLEAVIGADAYSDMRGRGRHFIDWARALDHAPQGPVPVEPTPKPPVKQRPRKLSVTQVETLIRDPYAIHAAKILELDPLPPLEEDADAALRGSIVHDGLANYIESALLNNGQLGDAAGLMTLFEDEMSEAEVPPHTRALWRARMQRIADWFVATEAERRASGAKPLIIEQSGYLDFDAPAGPFTLSARADRIDMLDDGSAALIDYKTGAPPTIKQVAAGLSPQLTLEAAIAERGGFANSGALVPGELIYIRLSGAFPAGEIRRVAPTDEGDTQTLADEALAGFKELVARYDDANQPYRPRLSAKLSRAEEPYDHLSRFKEWSTADGGSEGGE
ncbi:double-strand break repair protein AddB [Tepidamorphus sp. 3E244]|uniref:double-strand break repair protein AddB n=1 Tax=Tepidamorphus sp. 3E244 TaxID=3385498 RepID=UPI0038FCD48F